MSDSSVNKNSQDPSPKAVYSQERRPSQAIDNQKVTMIESQPFLQNSRNGVSPPRIVTRQSLCGVKRPIVYLILLIALIWAGLYYFVWSGLPKPFYSNSFSSQDAKENQVEGGESISSDQKLHVAVYYEVLCPDSRYFIRHELHPTYKKIGDIMDVHFVPYGKASHHKKPEGGYDFKCQHGPSECLGNTVHACATKYVKDQNHLVEYIFCMMGDDYDGMVAGKNCASYLDIDFAPIETCANGLEGQKLLAVFGDETHALVPRVSFIPTIEIDKSQDGQKAMLKNFLSQVCAKYKGERPRECIPSL